MKVTVWLVKWERATLVAAAETLVVGLLLLTGPGIAVRLLIGLPILAHLGYSALTSLPIGAIPKRPDGRQQRRNLDLRMRITAFLSEVRRAEEYAQRQRHAGRRGGEAEANIRAAHRRMMVAAADVVSATGRSVIPIEPALDRARVGRLGEDRAARRWRAGMG